MILVNKKQVELAKLAGILGINIPIDKILKKPLFEINPALIVKDPANGPLAVKHRNTMEFPCYFNTYLVNGQSVEIRYCTNRTPDPKFMGQTEKYSPRVVEFDGKAEFVADDKDKAVYFWLHFYNKTSPFRKPGVPHEYELVDDEGRANELITLITLRSKATAHAAALSGQELRITAKGMKIAGASAMEDLSLRAHLMQFASDKPAEYLNRAESQVNHIEGLIRDSIDKGIFVLENVFNSKRWKWALGVKAGEVIVEMSTTVTDDSQALITHIAQNIQEFLPVLINTSKTINAQSNLEQALTGVNVLDMLKSDNGNQQPQKQQDVPPPYVPPVFTQPVQETNNFIPPAPPQDEFSDDDDTDNPDILSIEQQEAQKALDDISNDSVDAVDIDPLPTSYKEAQEYLGRKIGKKTPALASELNNGIQEGKITKANIDMILAEYKEL